MFWYFFAFSTFLVSTPFIISRGTPGSWWAKNFSRRIVELGIVKRKHLYPRRFLSLSLYKRYMMTPTSKKTNHIYYIYI